MEIKGNTMGFEVGQRFEYKFVIKKITDIKERFDRAGRSHITIIVHDLIKTGDKERVMRGTHTPRELKQFLKRVGATKLDNKETLNVIDAIKELSTGGITNVLRDQADYLINGYTLPREELEQFAQQLVDQDEIDEIYFILELESE